MVLLMPLLLLLLLLSSSVLLRPWRSEIIKDTECKVKINDQIFKRSAIQTNQPNINSLRQTNSGVNKNSIINTFLFQLLSKLVDQGWAEWFKRMKAAIPAAKTTLQIK